MHGHGYDVDPADPIHIMMLIQQALFIQWRWSNRPYSYNDTDPTGPIHTVTLIQQALFIQWRWSNWPYSYNDADPAGPIHTMMLIQQAVFIPGRWSNRPYSYKSSWREEKYIWQHKQRKLFRANKNNSKATLCSECYIFLKPFSKKEKCCTKYWPASDLSSFLASMSKSSFEVCKHTTQH